MTILVLSGTGPTLELDSYFTGTLFDETAADDLQRSYFGYTERRISLDRLKLKTPGGAVPLLRRQAAEDIPHLTTATLASILRDEGAQAEMFDLAHVWATDLERETTSPDAVLLSTSFIVNKYQLTGVLRWITARFDAPIVLGGQYSNIKYPLILRDHPEVNAVISGGMARSLWGPCWRPWPALSPGPRSPTWSCSGMDT